MVLLGRFKGVMNGSLAFGDEVVEHMRFADEASAAAKRVIDQYIERAGLDGPAAHVVTSQRAPIAATGN